MFDMRANLLKQNNTNFNQSDSGFTLIELMVVVTIMGILMASGIVAFLQSQKNARDARRKADVHSIFLAFEQYHQDHNDYIRSATGANSTGAGWTGTWQTTFGGYFPSGKLPLDPKNTTAYHYEFRSNKDADYSPAKFCVAAILENTNGNCSDVTDQSVDSSMYTDPLYGKCVFVTPGTGTMYCEQNRL
jgi:prepilin-type N-terminal cleavage/methylation domain-containing protein